MSARAALGGLRRRLVLETPLDTVDDNGGASRVYVAGPELWANVSPLAMSRRFVAAREEAAITHHVEFRFRDDVEVAARFRDGARLYRVLAVEDADLRRTRLRALCEEVRP